MRNIFILAGAVVCSLSATPAVAADFTGPRVEIRGGWNQLKMESDYDDEDGIAFASADGDDNSFTIGGEIGYDIPIGPGAIAGAYAGLEYGGAKPSGALFDDYVVDTSVGRNLTLGVRAGAVISPTAMLYVKGGYSRDRLKIRVDSPSVTSSFSNTSAREGIHFGVGGEMSVASNAYVRAEYVRTTYEYVASSVSFLVEDEPEFRLFGDHKANRSQFLVGVGLRF